MKSNPVSPGTGRFAFLLTAVLLFGITSTGFATNFVVDKDGSAIDNNIGNGACATAGGGCTLHAAMQEANNAPGGPHTITFSIPVVTLTTSLPVIIKNMTIDGAFGAPRVEIVGNPGAGGFNISAGGGGILPGSGTTIENLVIRNMGSNGISITDGGNQVFNCYIGTDKTGTVAQANNGDGISITSTAAGAFGFPPNLSGVGFNWIGNPGLPATGNLISGNTGVGVNIFAQRTVLNVVAYNKIGTNFTGALAIPNGSHGVAISGDAFANTIGPGNIISGNSNPNSDGINIAGQVRAPNVVTANIIGPSSLLITDLGNKGSGVRIDSTRFDVSMPDAVELGPANIIGYNNEHGVFLTGACDKIRVFGNFIGVAEDPANAGTFLDLGNVMDGIRITTAGHQIGGATVAETNVISANNASGIRLQSTATDIKIVGNIIGRDPSNSINFGNTLDGITIANTGNNIIGGTSSGEGNVIAGNGRNGIKINSSGAGWANLITRNSIFGNKTVSAKGLGIDLEVVADDVDPTDNSNPGQDPNIGYSNNSQNAPVVGTAANVPHYDPATGNTIVKWVIDTSLNAPLTLEFFASNSPGFNTNGEGQRYLGSVTTTTDGVGHAFGTSVITPPSAYDTRGKYITMTATSTDTVPDLPGPATTGLSNNTSEFSNAVQVPNPGSLQFSTGTFTGTEGVATATVTVTRSGGSQGAVSIDYTTANNTAIQPGDYATASGTLNWADGDVASKTFPVTIVNDNIFEGTESLNLSLSNPGGFAALGAPSTAVLNITDNDTQPAISIDDVSHLEGNAGTTSYTFNVTLSNPSSQTVTAQYATADVTANAGSDYALVTGTVTFPPNSTSQPVTVLVNGDVTNEPDETFAVNLTAPANASILDSQGLGTIQNDDPPAISINDVSLNEGNSGNTAFGFTISLSNASAQTVTVNWTTNNGTATTADSDYTSANGVATFLPGSTSQPVTVQVTGDSKFETTETFTVDLSTPANATISDSQGVGTIQNDDALPAISINDVSHNEGNAGTTAYDFVVSLTNPSSQIVTVNYTTNDATATLADNDYATATGTVTFPAGTTTQPLQVLVNGDTNNEPVETFTVDLSTPGNATISDNQGAGTILNDDSLTPTFSVDNVTQSEGNAGTSTYTFTVTLAPAAASQVTVDATTADGTALVADGDYVAKTATLTFPAGVTTQTFVVTVNGDLKFEGNETFAVNLSANTAGTALGGNGSGTINNDDAQPAISINDVAQNEGNAGTTAFNFNVTLSNPSFQTVTVKYATADGTATIANNDYATTSGLVTFPPGSVTQPVTVLVNGDGAIEPNETFSVDLNTPGNASIADAQGIGTIQDDDGATSAFTINDVTQNEGNSGSSSFTFTVTLTPAAASTITIVATAADGTATTADGDYVANTQLLTFPAGTTTQPFTVTVNGDNKFEANETFSVNLSANSAGSTVADATGAGGITNDDLQPAISITDVSLAEGNAGSTPFNFAVTLSNPSAQTVTVDYATADGSATIANSDYGAASGTVTFLPGSVSQPVTVLANGDATAEPNETFVVNLTNPGNAAIADNQGTGTIIDDDSLPGFSVGNVTLNEGNAGITSFDFTVTLSPAAASTLTVQATTADGTATVADGDYAAKTQTLTFPPGTTTQTFSVAVNGDTKFELNDAFSVNLTANSGASVITNATGTGTITNDDGQPTIRIADTSGNEGNAGNTPFTFTVDLSNPSYQTITVDYTTADGTATSLGNDYTPSNGTVTFAPGVVSQPAVIQVKGDIAIEANETFVVNLTNPVNATIAQPQGTGTITNDDFAAAIPTLGGLQLALLALLLGTAALFVMRRS
jgi:hypothetical protein